MANTPFHQLAHRARGIYYNLIRGDTSQARGPDVLNNEALQSINVAGTGLVSLIKAKTDDTVELPNGAVITGNATVSGTLAVTGATTLTGAIALTGGATIPTAKTLVVTDADALTVGGVIVPQYFQLTFRLPGTQGATAGNFVCSDILRAAAIIVSVTERHATAGTDGSAVTVMVKKVPSGTAVGSGTDCLSAGLSMKSTADTNQSGSLHATAANYTFAAGDSLGFALTGTPTALASPVFTVVFRRV